MIKINCIKIYIIIEQSIFNKVSNFPLLNRIVKERRKINYIKIYYITK